MAVALNLPTKAQTGSGEQKTPLPKGRYLAKIAYYYFDKQTHMGCNIEYQEVRLHLQIDPADALTPEIQATLDKDGFYTLNDGFNELKLLPERETTDGRKLKPSPLVRRFNAVLANHGKQFTDESNLEYVPHEEKFKSLGIFPVYRDISREESEQFEAANGRKPTGDEKYKILEGKEQEIYQGVMLDIKIDGISTVGQWVSVDLDVNAKGYNTCGADSIHALSSMERKMIAMQQGQPPAAQTPAAATDLPGL